MTLIRLVAAIGSLFLISSSHAADWPRIAHMAGTQVVLTVTNDSTSAATVTALRILAPSVDKKPSAAYMSLIPNVSIPAGGSADIPLAPIDSLRTWLGVISSDFPTACAGEADACTHGMSNFQERTISVGLELQIQSGQLTSTVLSGIPVNFVRGK